MNSSKKENVAQPSLIDACACEMPSTKNWQAASHLRAAGADQAWVERARRTFAGQSSWALDDTKLTCATCRYWNNCGKPTKNYTGSLIERPRSCDKYRQLTGKTGAAVPHDAIACRFYEEKETSCD